MTFDIVIKSDLKKLRRDLTRLERSVVPQTIVRTLNRTAESARVASSRHIAPQLNSRQAGVKRRIDIQKATFKRLWATLVANGRPLQLIEFVVGSKKATQQPGGKRGRVKTKVFGKTKTYYSAFIAPQRSGSSQTTVYKRKGGKRLPLKMMFGPGIVQLFKQKENVQIMENKVKERILIEFARNLAYYIERMKRR